ncbi:MAG TPA: DUF4124 domain-containing protein [Methylomirabilota bacterium]|nr:DUF4124 domain-containing protein [Methylomirabilota bacterium]
MVDYTVLRTASFVVLALVLTAAPAHAAEVYKTTHADGSVTYSDTPKPPADASAPAERRAPAPDKAPDRPPAATADEVLQLAGLRAQLEATPARMASEFKPRGVRLNAEDAAALEQILARHFGAERLYAQVRGEFNRRADARKLGEVAEWLRSPLGSKIAALEAAAAVEADAPQRMLAFAPGGRGGPAAARVAIVERMDWTAGITDGTLESTLAVARAMAMAINRALPPDERQTTALIERQIQQLRGQSRAKLAQTTVTFLLYQYRSLDDEELQQYADFLASDGGRWYSATISKAMNRTVAAAAQRAASDVIRAIPPPRWSGSATASPRH